MKVLKQNFHRKNPKNDTKMKEKNISALLKMRREEDKLQLQLQLQLLQQSSSWSRRSHQPFRPSGGSEPGGFTQADASAFILGFSESLKL